MPEVTLTMKVKLTKVDGETVPKDELKDQAQAAIQVVLEGESVELYSDKGEGMYEITDVSYPA